MIKIRFDIETGVLSGWVEEGFIWLIPRDENDGVAILDIEKPEPSDDYEYWRYDGLNLVRSDKPEPIPRPEPRDFGAEIDQLKADVAKDLKDLKDKLKDEGIII